jgi:hypothetical protein
MHRSVAKALENAVKRKLDFVEFIFHARG